MSGRDLAQENRELRAQIKALVGEAATNERLMRKNQTREIEVLRAETLPRLFTVVCERLRTSYALDVVTLLLADPDHEIRHLLLGDKVALEQFPDVVFADSLAGMAPQLQGLHAPWLGAYVAAEHRLLVRAPHRVQSLALIPLRRQRRLHGCVVFGSRDPQRFVKHLGTDFLAHLGLTVSFAVENATNRARLVRSGFTDVLTGWHNRRYLQERLAEELASARRQGTGLVCLLVDLDHFKEVNDRYGHLAGDLALREVAARINTQMRGSDAAARYGGDEFVLLLPNAHCEQGRALGERIRAAVSGAPVDLGSGQSGRATVSIGLACVEPARDEGDLHRLGERLFAAADAALYRAKRLGRDRVEAEC